jgi:hypothetical protein
LEALKEFVRTGDGKGLSYTLRKNVRENVKYLPQAAFFTMESTPIIFEAKGSKRVMCEYHRKGKDTTFKADTLTELHGMAFKGSKSEGDLKKGEGVLKKNELQAPPLVGHLHCGCPAIEVALEFLLWKTSEAFSSNPMVAGTVYRMTDLHMLKPSVRAFWNQTLRNYTGLHNADFFGVDYGTPIYAIRLALNQLHVQIERLKVLGAPVNVTMDFTDKVNFNVSDEVVQYGLEVGAIMTSAQLEAMWEDIIKRQVLPLRMLEVDWD